MDFSSKDLSKFSVGWLQDLKMLFCAPDVMKKQMDFYLDIKTFIHKKIWKTCSWCYTIFLFPGSAPPWVNPNAPKTVPMKKFHVSLNHQSSETRLSKRAPFAPRINAGPKIWDQPKVVNGKVLTAPEYNSLEDPHLGAYFARKMGVKPRLSDGSNSKVCI